MSTKATSLQTSHRLYRMMYLVRRTEEVLMKEYHPADEMRCPIHFCVGQEAMPAALAGVLRRKDVLMSHYRSHGYYLAKGASLDAMVCEFYGKAAGSNGGVAGSMELASHDHSFYSGAIVGGSLLIPLGSAFAQQYRGVDDISVSVMGDGSFDEGVTYEAFNLAALHKLPLLIICENNKYAAHTPVEKRLSTPLIAERARAFGLPVVQLDGNDPELLLTALERVVPDIRAGKGPRFIEIETYRHCAHVGPDSDDALKYRPAEELARWKARDPVVMLRKRLAEAGGTGEIARLEAEVEAQIKAAVETAKRAKFPDFQAMLASNWSGEYAAVAARFISGTAATFEGGQSEARLGPF
jgi:TPP-dependent pyruvate/acetoin dehydrogenase alpha subunit